jgi:hypothetical protein
MWEENIDKFSNVIHMNVLQNNNSSKERGRSPGNNECFFNVPIKSSAKSKNDLFFKTNAKLIILFWAYFCLILN